MANSDARGLGVGFGHCDLHKSVAAIGGLLTLPVLQANTLRLEAIAHLALANCDGRRSPTLQNASRWFKSVGTRVGRLEDPAEDVFVTRVIFDGANYRILEGLREANGHHLQHILHAVEGMPDRGKLRAAKRSCEALLVLSDLLCARAGLDAFLEGSEHPLEALPIKSIPTMKQLAARTTFSYRDLAVAGCDVQWLSRFVLPPDEQSISWSPNEPSAFDRQPLLDTGSEIIAALPSALGAAVREAVIETFIRTGNDLRLRMQVLRSQTEALAQNPMFRKARIPGASADPNNPLVPSPPVEIEPGYWVHCVLLVDDLEGFEEGGLWGYSSRGSTISPALQTEIEQASAFCRAQPGFKSGLTFGVICGFGRGFALGYDGAEGWLVEVVTDYDVDVIGWLHNFDFSELIKLSTMDLDLRSKGFTLEALSGLIAKVSIAHENGGHLVPHEAMPDEFDAGVIYIPTNAHLGLRAAHHRRWDVRSIAAPDDRTAVVRLIGGSELLQEAKSRIYVDPEDLERGILRGAWLGGSHTWWVHVSSEEIVDKNLFWNVWDMQCVWIERIARTLIHALPSPPDFLVWRLNFARWEEIPATEVLPATPEEIERDVATSIEVGSATIVTEIGPAFYRGLSRSDNAAEAAVVRSFVEQVVPLCGRTDQSIESFMVEIVPSPDARQMHAFAPQDFRDHVREAIGSPPVLMSRLDDAALRIGLGWLGVDRPGGTLQGKIECCRALNEITSALEQEFCQELARFERHALIEAAIANHEAAACDRSTWHRTSGALIGMAEDEHAIRSKIAEHHAKLNTVSLTSRILIEAGLSECPFGTGETPADIDLSRLMAKASMIFYLGGYSDAIHYGGMKPEVRISPAGQVLIDPAFFDVIVEPAGRSLADKVIDEHRDRYTELLREPDLETRPLGEIVEGEFLEAWQAEVGASLADCRGAVEALETKLVDAGVGWEMMPRPELVAFLDDHIRDPEAYVAALESVPQKGWKSVPNSFVDQDRQPWRFGRRLSVYRRPLMRLSNFNNALVVVVPGFLRASLLMMMHNYYGAGMDQELLISRKMRWWWNLVQDRDAKDFEQLVCAELQKMGWGAVSRKKFPEILGKGLLQDPGDIDVLAWRSDGRIVVLECKNLQFARTPSEIAKQLFKYQGAVDEKGRPDMLAKHLKRVALARKHVAKLQKYTGVGTGSIEGALVFSNSVPMVFAKQQIENSERHLTFDQLSSL